MLGVSSRILSVFRPVDYEITLQKLKWKQGFEGSGGPKKHLQTPQNLGFTWVFAT